MSEIDKINAFKSKENMIDLFISTLNLPFYYQNEIVKKYLTITNRDEQTRIIHHNKKLDPEKMRGFETGKIIVDEFQDNMISGMEEEINTEERLYDVYEYVYIQKGYYTAFDPEKMESVIKKITFPSISFILNRKTPEQQLIFDAFMYASFLFWIFCGNPRTHHYPTLYFKDSFTGRTRYVFRYHGWKIEDMIMDKIKFFTARMYVYGYEQNWGLGLLKTYIGNSSIEKFVFKNYPGFSRN